RITSGVELNFFNNKKNTDQIKEAIFRLKKIIPLKKQLTKEAWLGSRPTIVDSMPMIGKAPKHEKLWFNFGHNHIGLSTSAGSAKVLGEMIKGKKVSINFDPFLPSRFKL
ncbi:FAD-binding oxidoreductase, partial [Alphaproteobacteria bacterium]|nr:FAD-binding oxidoreductase [Alphaproteobacteria bacterium]